MAVVPYEFGDVAKEKENILKRYDISLYPKNFLDNCGRRRNKRWLEEEEEKEDKQEGAKEEKEKKEEGEEKEKEEETKKVRFTHCKHFTPKTFI